MDSAIASQVQLFRSHIESLKKDCHDLVIQEWGDDIVSLTPLRLNSSSVDLGVFQKSVGLTFGGLIHGNEWGSLGVLNGLLKLILNGVIRIDFPVGFFLGHPEAALKGERFLECDLNRSFPGKTPLNRPLLFEEKRARQIAPLLETSLFFVDFHQTIQKTATSFFIFGYRKHAFQFARSIHPHLPVVTHWAQGFSASGRCSDEYVTAKGGVGITIELGAIQKYYNPEQTAIGLHCALSAIETVGQLLRSPLSRAPHTTPSEDAKTEALSGLALKLLDLAQRSEGAAALLDTPQIYTWSHIEPWPQDGYVELVNGLTNFMELRTGEIMAYLDGKPIVAPVAGRLLFPKYLSKVAQEELRTRGQLPKELFRIMKACSIEDLPQNL